MGKTSPILCTCVWVLAVLPGPMAADCIRVTNTSEEMQMPLSDLIVYGENDKMEVIVRPGDPNDDVWIPPGEHRLFTADFRITGYTVSAGYLDDKGVYHEWETLCTFTVERVVPRALAMIRDPNEQQEVVLAIDDAVAFLEPWAPGTILTVVDGRNELWPGCFVGTGIDLQTGQATGAHTGDVEVFSAPFEVLTFTPPYPPDAATGAPLDAVLVWPKSDVDHYEVYLGTEYRLVRDANKNSTEYRGSPGASENHHDPGPLTPCTTYYWRITEVSYVWVQYGEFWVQEERIVEGPVRSFTTGAEPCPGRVTPASCNILAYDDGKLLRLDTTRNALLAVRCTPVAPAIPFDLTGLQVMFRSYHNSTSGADVWVVEANDTLDPLGPPSSRLPAGVLPPAALHVAPPLPDCTWAHLQLPEPIRFEGDFFVIVRQKGGAPSEIGGAWVGMDDGTTEGRTFKSYDDGQTWLDEPLGDALIRAEGVPCACGCQVEVDHWDWPSHSWKSRASLGVEEKEYEWSKDTFEAVYEGKDELGRPCVVAGRKNMLTWRLRCTNDASCEPEIKIIEDDTGWHVEIYCSEAKTK